MKTLNTAYAKSIEGTTFYFVKSFQIFPEYKDVPPILRKYGMHTNFEVACNIADIYDKEIQHELLNTLERDVTSANVLPLYPSVAEIYSLRRKQTHIPSLTSLIKLFRLG